LWILLSSIKFIKICTFVGTNILYVLFIIEFVCDNCSNIIINGEVNPSEVAVCNRSTIHITLSAPQNILGEIIVNTLRINGTNYNSMPTIGNCSPIGNVTSRNLTYECRMVQTGNYSGHVGFTCGSVYAEWCSLNTTVTVINCNGMPCIICAAI